MQLALSWVPELARALSVVLNVAVVVELSRVLNLCGFLELSRVLKFRTAARGLPLEEEPGGRPQRVPSLVVFSSHPWVLCRWPSWAQQLVIQ